MDKNRLQNKISVMFIRIRSARNKYIYEETVIIEDYARKTFTELSQNFKRFREKEVKKKTLDERKRGGRTNVTSVKCNWHERKRKREIKKGMNAVYYLMRSLNDQKCLIFLYVGGGLYCWRCRIYTVLGSQRRVNFNQLKPLHIT